MPRFRQAVELARVLTLPGAVAAFMRWKPFSITAFRMLHAMRQQGLVFRTILDGGANAGQFARAATETYPEARVVAFEALPEVAEVLRANLHDRAQVRIVQCALGNREGEMTFYRNAYSLASSALPLDATQAAGFPELRQQEALSVPVARLDTLLADETLAGPVLLKLDLQGYELEALRGAPKTLAKTDYVLLETAFKPVYQDEPLFSELYAFMQEQGFRFLRPIDFLTDADGVIVQMDALFARTDESTA